MNFIEQTCNQLVHPPKLKYSRMDLGPSITPLYQRKDFQIPNKENQSLQASLYIPRTIITESICIVYLHSMNGCRLQCLAYVEGVMAMGVHLCCFDFSGCGGSQGASISFGANQKYDVEAVLQYLGREKGLNRIVLWGRSMGAVAGVKYCEYLQERGLGLNINGISNQISVEICGIILDSPFQSLKKLIIQLGCKRSDLPSIFMHAFYQIIKSTLQKKGKFKVEDLQLTKSMGNICDVSVCFMVSKADTTIDASHSQNLFSAYRGWDKRINYFDGLHNEARDQGYLGSVYSFIRDRMQVISNTNRSRYGRYKRIELQKQLSRRGMGDGQESNQDCMCNIFNATSAK